MASSKSTVAFGDAYSSFQAHTINGPVHIALALENILSRLPHAEDAPFNSYAKQHEPICLSDTRVSLLREIYRWADEQDGRYIFWLSGLAGTGKSTIARTVAHKYSKEKRLAASFFFSRGGGDVGHAGKFVTSVAKQLAHSVSASRQHIIDAVAEHSDIVNLSLREQWHHLVLRPLLKLHEAATEPGTYVMIVDALDECENNDDIRIIVQLLAEVRSLTGVRLQVFITSRPEVPIRHTLGQIADVEHKNVLLHNIEQSIVEHDIKVFLENRLGSIRRECCLRTGWPGEEIIMQLVKNASGLFIWAATACRFIRDGRRFATKRLETILSTDSNIVHAPEKHLDQIYITVLKSSLSADFKEEEIEEHCNALRYILGSIAVLFSPLSAQCLSKLLYLSDVNQTLEHLHAILNVPEDPLQPLRLHHPSFRDFLFGKDRCIDDKFRIDERSAQEKLASRCLELMSRPSGLRQDICDLSKPGTLRSEIGEEVVASSLSSELQYACRYWVDHLERSQQSIADKDTVHVFLQTHLLHWLEAMSLMGETDQCVRLISKLQTLVMSSTSSCACFLRDANRFVLRFCSILAEAPLQVYLSALAFAPETSVVRQTYARADGQVMEMLSGREADWDACQSVLEGHSSDVLAVMFSPDGQLVASASHDKTVRVWEMAARTCRSVLEGHSDWASAVVFSPDGQLVASASYDKTVRVWETATGTCRSVMEGHSLGVKSVVFSPDGEFVASASSDETVRLWETATGMCRSVLKDHSGYVRAVVFSPDGQLVASASEDKTVRLWETATGMCRSVLEGHSLGVLTALFSPDGQLVASASEDKTVRVWETATGTCRSVLEGHSESVRAVVFSPDGQLVASASSDWAVRVWETATGTCRSVLKGHSSDVLTVMFSPDGQLVASASDDKTVRVWETTTGMCRSVLKGHSGYVTAVVFSPDGQLVASASLDKTVRVWETGTRTCHRVMEGHSPGVSAVEFSPDGQFVASACEDKTVRLWETATGICRSVLEGHSGYVTVVVFSPDRQLVASASLDKTVRVWETAMGMCRSVLEGHSGYVRAVVFSPDGQLVASVSYDKTIRVWETATGTCRSVLDSPSPYIEHLAFSPDNQILHTSEGDYIRLPGALTLTSPVEQEEQTSNLSVHNQWVIRNMQPLLWLPFEYRTNRTAVWKDLVCLGYSSGRMVLFRLQ